MSSTSTSQTPFPQQTFRRYGGSWMRYVVRHEGKVSTVFKSTIGVLTSDSASPGLWNLYFADLRFEPDRDDMRLDGVPISNGEHADDVVLMSTTPAGAQRRMDTFFLWCTINFMVISIMKTLAMRFGTIPGPAPALSVGGNTIDMTEEYKFVGIKASQARSAARSIFAAEPFVGVLPIRHGLQLYMARVDPHLTAGCEVVVDIDNAFLARLEAVQLEYIRRLLRVGKRSVRAVLFTETGIMPLRYRRLILALGYAKYLVMADETTSGKIHAKAAYRESIAMARKGLASWARI